MSTVTLHPRAEDYLDCLEHAARRLPRRERRELVEEIEGTWFGAAFLAAGSIGQVCSGSNTGPTHCTGGPSTIASIGAIALFVFLVIGPIFTTVYLARRAR